jgi:hypothetical protein
MSEYNLTTGAVTQFTHFANEEYACNLTISPNGQQVVFELTREFDGPSDLWIMERDGSDLLLLVANAAHPARSWRERRCCSESIYRLFSAEFLEATISQGAGYGLRQRHGPAFGPGSFPADRINVLARGRQVRFVVGHERGWRRRAQRLA